MVIDTPLCEYFNIFRRFHMVHNAQTGLENRGITRVSVRTAHDIGSILHDQDPKIITDF